DQHIFQNKYGTGTITIQYVNRQLKAIFSKYKINSKKVSSHTLRKTFGLRVFEKNYKSEEALITLSHIFNHSSTAITRRYIGLQAEKIQNVYLSL
ncbi:MAG: tyrosine-type recombinase/integrase, partial [Fulvivirga sp.]